MYVFFTVIGLGALAASLFFLVYGIVCAAKKKGKKRIIRAFCIFAALAACVFLFNHLTIASQHYDSALYEIRRTSPLGYSLNSAMNDFKKAGVIKDSRQSFELLDALFHGKNPQAFLEKAEAYFQNRNSSISRQDFCRHLYFLLASQDAIPARDAWEYYNAFLRGYVENIPASDEVVIRSPLDCIGDPDGEWLSACGAGSNGKAVVYIRYSAEDLEKMDSASIRNGISLRYQHLLDTSLLPSRPEEVEYIVLVQFSLLYQGSYSYSGPLPNEFVWIPAYQQTADVGVYRAGTMELLKSFGTAYGEALPEGVLASKGKRPEYIVGSDISADKIERLVSKAAAYIAEQKGDEA